MKAGHLSPLGFFAAALASSVGLGNLWRFPYVALAYGGEFFLAYLLAVAVGLALVYGEMKARRLDRLLPLAALTTGLISLYYGPLTAFTLTLSLPLPELAALLIVMGLAAFVVGRGLREGIEPFSKLSMVLLFLLLLFVAFHFPLSLPPFHWANLLLPSLWIDALSQALFSLSAGMGIFYFYSRHSSIANPIPFVLGIGVGDTLAAFLGYHIVSAQGLERSFLVGFEGLRGAMGSLGGLFFFALFLAAFSSLVSMMALPTFLWRASLIAIPLGALAISSLSLEELLDALATRLLLPVTASAIAISAARELGGPWRVLYAFPLLYAIAVTASVVG